MKSTRTTGIVVFAAVLGALIWLAVLDYRIPALTRGGQPFLIPAPSAETVVAQEFGVWVCRGLRGVRIEAETGGSAGTLDAALVELQAGKEREVRRARLSITPGMPDCCDIRFDRVSSSAGKEFRLDLRFEGPQPLKLLVTPTGAKKGGFTLNGRSQPANLRLDLVGAVAAPARGHGIPLAAVLAYAAVVSGAVAAAVCALLSASNPRRS